jgi:hypothetical protein
MTATNPQAGPGSMKRALAVGCVIAMALGTVCRSPLDRRFSSPEAPVSPDWLITPGPYKAGIEADPDAGTLRLSNGLVERTFWLRPNAATVDLRNLVTCETLLRAVRPEAVVVIDGRSRKIGGLEGQVEQAYLAPEALAHMTSDPAAFRFRDYRSGPLEQRFPWKRRWADEGRPWPPAGISLTLNFDPPAGEMPGVSISIVYELYDGIPLLAKRLILRNAGTTTVRLNAFTSEILAAVEAEASVNSPPAWDTPGLHVESDYAFLADSPETAARTTTVWRPDPAYTSQINWPLVTPCLLESRPPLGPDQDIAPGAAFESFTNWELVFDSTERERRGLALRRMYRTIAPWVTENPILMHLRSSDPAVIRAAVDQAAGTGFEMVILSFGSGLDMESEETPYLATMKAVADYAHGRGVGIGGYSLLASRRIDDKTDVIDPRTGKPGGAAFGSSPCLGSAWGEAYFRKLRNFLEKTGFDLLEHDGSYPGDACASTKHSGHRGLWDSQWTQWRRITDFYKWCRARGIYLNVPDWYFLSGSNKTAMGYREVNWSLPRDRQVILGRQNIFDGTWTKTPSMGWMFLPLVEYQGGGATATIEPLSEHLGFYEAHLAQNFLSGVQACYRGTRLYDTETTEAAVKKWVDLYKRYRAILDSDIIHLRRPDGRSLDGILHVNPALRTKGFAVFYNPTENELAETWTLPLYYTGLTDVARIAERGGPARSYRLDRSLRVRLPLRLGPGERTWFVIE